MRQRSREDTARRRREDGKKMSKTLLTREFAWATATDAGNRSMRSAERSAWNSEDYATAVAEELLIGQGCMHGQGSEK